MGTKQREQILYQVWAADGTEAGAAVCGGG